MGLKWDRPIHRRTGKQLTQIKGYGAEDTTERKRPVIATERNQLDRLIKY